MRKFLSLFTAALLALSVNAAVINIDNTSADALRIALSSAANGDVIEMAAGTYVESNNDYIAFAGKDVTVRAAEGAEVILQPQVSITVSEGGCAHFQNVKIDASRLLELANWYEHLIYAADANANNSVVLEGCEVYNFNLNNAMLYCAAGNKLAAVTINNSYIHNTMKSVLFVQNETDAINVQVTNSTFANIATNADSYWAGIIDLRASSSQLLVDHCTFYNVIPMNTDYSCVSKITLANGAASNCIFMLPTAQDGIRAMRGVVATNCITFNYLKDSGTGIHSSVTKNNCVQVDPQFVDAANGNFALAEGSPALTMNDGQPIGDPRWNAAAPQPADPTVSVRGTMNDWGETPFVLSDDKTYASLTIEDIPAGDYNFKMFINGEWRSNGYTFHRGFTGAAGIIGNDDNNMVFQADVRGAYTFTWTFANDSLGFVYPEAPQPVDEWAEIIFTEPVAAADIAADATFTAPGSTFSLQVTDPDNKMAIDANTARFGTVEAFKDYTHRLKTGGKTNENVTKNFMTLNIPEAGQLRIAVRTGSNSDETRTLVIKQGETELYNQVVKEADKTVVTDGENSTNYYPYVLVNVAAGQVVLSYPVNAINFYAFGFKAGQEPQPVEHTYTVAGSSDVAFGTAWTPSVEANDMVLVEGLYTWEKENLTLAAGNIEFKVCEDHAWTNCWPAQNYVLNIAEAGIYTVKITFNAETKDVAAVATKTGDAVVIPTSAMHGNFLGSWANTDNFAIADGNATASLTLNLAAGNYEFGMRIGGAGNWTANGAAFTRENPSAVIEAGSGNLTLAADVAGDYVFTWTYETNTLAITFPAAAPASPWESWFGDANWGQENDSYLEYNAETGKATVHIGQDKTGQWHAQVKYHGISSQPNKFYHVGLKMKANNAVNGVTLKWEDNTGILWVDQAINLVANTEFVYDEPQFMSNAAGNGVLVLDFGWAHNGDIIELYDVVIEEVAAPELNLENGYYLIGINGWSVYDLAAADKFAANTEADGEYMLTTTLAAGNELKVVAVADNAIATWYPEGANYVVDNAHAGEKTIYFRPNADGGDDWFGGCIYVPANEGPVSPIKETWFANTSWQQEFESTIVWDPETDKITINVAVEKNAQWQAQLKLFTLVPETGKCYNVAFKLKANNALGGITFKWQDDNNDPNLIYENQAITLEAGVEYAYNRTVAGIPGNGIAVFDFGYAKVGDIIELYDFVITEVECPEPEVVDYYLVGTITDWAVVADDAHHFAATEVEGEFVLSTTLAVGDGLKVVGVQGETQTWYPDGMGNEYVVDADHAGLATIYFRPAGNADWAAFGGYIFVDVETGIDNTAVEVKAVKVLRDGQLLIIKGEKTFNAQGQLVK